MKFNIRRKILFYFTLLLFSVLSATFIYVSSVIKSTIETSFNNELSNSTKIVAGMVETVAISSIKKHLKTIAELNFEIVNGIYQRSISGEISKYEAMKLADKILLSQKVGKNGYLYAINSKGIVKVHPDKNIIEENVSKHSFIKRQMSFENSYIEYKWRNTDEIEEREKVLYMIYFKPWDWIISISAYKSDFESLIDIDELRSTLSRISFGKTGYPYILNGNGDYIFHPKFIGNINDVLDEKLLKVAKQIINTKTGKVFYKWKNPDEPNFRNKVSILRYIEEYNWIVASSAYLTELYEPLEILRKNFIVFILFTMLLILFFSYWISSLIVKPLITIIEHFKDKSPEDLDMIIGINSNDEAGKLARYLNLFIERLDGYKLSIAKEIMTRQFSEQAHVKSEKKFHALFDYSFQFIALLGPNGRVLEINRTALKFRNLNESDILGMFFWKTPWWNHSASLIDQIKSGVNRAAKGETVRFEITSNDVEYICFDVSVKPINDDKGNILFLIAEARDVTEVRRAEESLKQAQKMESVGTLAGGIAHDFNNILGGILGSISILKFKRDRGDIVSPEVLSSHLDMIEQASNRAKDLVNQLLTLSRKYELNFTNTNLNETIFNVLHIAESSFDKSIIIKRKMMFEDILVYADSSSLEQVFLNICINAAHSMTIMRDEGELWGGELAISANKFFVSEGVSRQYVLAKTGYYWKISISDTGVGMDSGTIDQVFTPFFTTKNKDNGTGLGLSMVYNIVKQHGGFVDVYSEVGKGTVFNIILPISDTAPEIVENSIEELIFGEGLILIIDDEQMLRDNAKEILEECGYEVITAVNGAEGVRLYQENVEKISVVLLDMVMPVMSGKEAYREMILINPNVKVLLSSGFRHDERIGEIIEMGACSYIQKPYGMIGLSKAINGVIES